MQITSKTLVLIFQLLNSLPISAFYFSLYVNKCFTPIKAITKQGDPPPPPPQPGQVVSVVNLYRQQFYCLKMLAGQRVQTYRELQRLLKPEQCTLAYGGCRVGQNFTCQHTIKCAAKLNEPLQH